MTTKTIQATCDGDLNIMQGTGRNIRYVVTVGDLLDVYEKEGSEWEKQQI